MLIKIGFDNLLTNNLGNLLYKWKNYNNDLISYCILKNIENLIYINYNQYSKKVLKLIVYCQPYIQSLPNQIKYL